jgi:hypothetical protein
MKIAIKYKLVGQKKWKTVTLSPKDYFDADYLDPGEKYTIDSVEKYWDEISYLPVKRRSVQYTKLTVVDPISKASQIITSTYWNAGKNFISERIDTRRGREYWEEIVSIELPTTPPVSEIIRIGRKNGNICPYYHGFIIDNPDGSQKEIGVYPTTRRKSTRFRFKRKQRSRKQYSK